MKYEILRPTCNLATVFDGRGGIFTWVPKDSIQEFNMLYFTPGAIRGNHYHPEFTEYFLVVEGSGVMVFKTSETTEEIVHMSKGVCTRAEPGIAHAFHAITPVTAVAMLSKPWDTCHPPIIHEFVTSKDNK
ncbi:MAG: cupin domain-containing protein [Bdellovibrionia bacterium]